MHTQSSFHKSRIYILLDILLSSYQSSFNKASRLFGFSHMAKRPIWGSGDPKQWENEVVRGGWKETLHPPICCEGSSSGKEGDSSVGEAAGGLPALHTPACKGVGLNSQPCLVSSSWMPKHYWWLHATILPTVCWKINKINSKTFPSSWEICRTCIDLCQGCRSRSQVFLLIQ